MGDEQIENGEMFNQSKQDQNDVSGLDNLISDLLNEDHRLSLEQSPSKGNHIYLQKFILYDRQAK